MITPLLPLHPHFVPLLEERNIAKERIRVDMKKDTLCISRGQDPDVSNKLFSLRKPSRYFRTMLGPSSYINIGHYGVILALFLSDTDILG